MSFVYFFFIQLVCFLIAELLQIFYSLDKSSLSDVSFAMLTQSVFSSHSLHSVL